MYGYYDQKSYSEISKLCKYTFGPGLIYSFTKVVFFGGKLFYHGPVGITEFVLYAEAKCIVSFIQNMYL